MANGMAQRYGCFDFLADLCQEGYIALIDAANRFDESKGFMFWSWAFLKVRGSMINALKRWHWDGTYTYPSSKGDDATYTLVSFDESFMGYRESRMVSMLDLKFALEALSERERYIIIKTYLEGYTLLDVGSEWHLEECTACNIRMVGLKKMRSHMEQIA